MAMDALCILDPAVFTEEKFSVEVNTARKPRLNGRVKRIQRAKKVYLTWKKHQRLLQVAHMKETLNGERRSVFLPL